MAYFIIFRWSSYIVTFLLFVSTTAAQGRLELKTEILGLAFDTRAEASLEYLLGERVGIEAGVGYDWDNFTNNRFDTAMMLIATDVESRTWSGYLKGKYYFVPKVGGDRFYAGLFFHYSTITSYKINGEESPRLGDASGLGIEGGYKWAIKERFIVEIGAYWLRSTLEDSRGNIGKINEGGWNARIGYRF